ncbi:MAG: oligosaccharide flippase family protein [Lysobacterales bacterium]
MPPDARPSLGTHFYRYGIGNLLILVAGFVSFPVLTRLLSNEQYGIFGYFETWLLVLLAVVKLGAQHAIIRLYPHGEGEASVRRFVASFLLAPFRYSILIWLVVVAGYAFISAHLEAGEVRAVGWCMVALLLPTVWTSLVNALIGAEERSSLYMRQTVIQRWAEMLAIVGTVAFINTSALGAYAARVVVACGMALWLARWLWIHHRPHLHEARPAEWRASLGFSLPLVANEVTGSLLALLDRVMLKHVLNDFAPVGVFAIGAGLAATLNTVINQALSLAFTQVSVRQYALEGAAAVVRTKRMALRIMVYACVLIAVGLCCAGRDFMLLLSGHDKQASAPVFVLIGSCYVIYGIVDLAGSGLLLQKRSKTVLALNVSAMLINATLNLLLIPRLGVTGAIYATLASYAWLGIGQFILCPRELRAWPDLRTVSTALALAALLTGVVLGTDMFGLASPLARLGMMALLSIVLFVVPAFVLDPVLRGYASTWLRRRRY